MQQGLLLTGQLQNCLVPQVEDFRRIAVQSAPGRRHGQRLGRPLQKLRVQLLFQIADVRTDRRLGKIQLLRRERKALIFCRVYKGLQLPNIHLPRVPSVSFSLL